MPALAVPRKNPRKNVSNCHNNKIMTVMPKNGAAYVSNGTSHAPRNNTGKRYALMHAIAATNNAAKPATYATIPPNTPQPNTTSAANSTSRTTLSTMLDSIACPATARCDASMPITTRANATKGNASANQRRITASNGDANTAPAQFDANHSPAASTTLNGIVMRSAVAAYRARSFLGAAAPKRAIPESKPNAAHNVSSVN